MRSGRSRGALLGKIPRAPVLRYIEWGAARSRAAKGGFMLHVQHLSTPKEGLVDITAEVRRIVRDADVKDGLCFVYCPHTTAAITINEHADPSVRGDILRGLRTAFPEDPAFRHLEGNSTAHLKSSAVGASETVIIEDGELVLGTWQGLYFCEFDGPRNRRYIVKILRDA